MRATPQFNNLARHIFPSPASSRFFHWEHHAISEAGVFYHFHPQFELNLIETPAARRVVGDNESTIRGAELVLISPNLPHRWDLDANRAEFWVVAFSLETLGTEFLSREEARPLRTLLASADHGLAFSPSTRDKVGEKIKALGSLVGLQRLATVLTVFDSLCQDTDARRIASDGYQSSGIEADYHVVARIISHFTGAHARATQRRPTLSAAARLANMSVPSFTRFFRRMTGDSFVSYVNRLRIARACTLLEETNRSVGDVAADAGYGNLSHFNRQFKEQTGVQPREYRARRR